MHDLAMITAMNADPSAFPPSENRGIPTRKKWTKREERRPHRVSSVSVQHHG
jgi:hypothetical protein